MNNEQWKRAVVEMNRSEVGFFPPQGGLNDAYRCGRRSIIEEIEHKFHSQVYSGIGGGQYLAEHLLEWLDEQKK